MFYESNLNRAPLQNRVCYCREIVSDQRRSAMMNDDRAISKSCGSDGGLLSEAPLEGESQIRDAQGYFVSALCSCRGADQKLCSVRSNTATERGD